MKKILLAVIFSFALLVATPQESFAACGAVEVDAGVTSCLDGASEITPYAVCERNTSVCCSTFAECNNVFPVENIIDGPSNAFFDSMNPLITEGSPVAADLSTPGGIVSRLLQFLFPLAGLVLFVMLVWGGFEILSKSTQGSKGVEAGRNRITAAIVGFLLLFATYWMAQIIEIVFGIVIV